MCVCVMLAICLCCAGACVPFTGCESSYRRLTLGLRAPAEACEELKACPSLYDGQLAVRLLGSRSGLWSWSAGSSSSFASGKQEPLVKGTRLPLVLVLARASWRPAQNRRQIAGVYSQLCMSISIFIMQTKKIGTSPRPPLGLCQSS
jgi:hypothetical protein